MRGSGPLLHRHRSNDQLRVEARLEPFHPPMEMRAGDAAGGADKADLLALPDALARLDVEPGKMGVARLQPIAVIDEDGVAGKEKLRGETYDAAAGGDDRRACRRGDVDPHMRRPRLAVEDALAAIDAADRPDRRPGHRLREERLGAGDLTQRADLARLAADTLEQDGVGRHRLLRQTVDALNIVDALFDGEAPLLMAAIGQGQGDDRRRRIAAEANDEATVGRNRHRAPVERHRGAGHDAAKHHAALDELAGELHGMRGHRRQAEHEKDQGRQGLPARSACIPRDAPDGAPNGSVAPHSSFGCCGACSGRLAWRRRRSPAVAPTSPSLNSRVSAAPGATLAALITALRSASRTTA